MFSWCMQVQTIWAEGPDDMVESWSEVVGIKLMGESEYQKLPIKYETE